MMWAVVLTAPAARGLSRGEVASIGRRLGIVGEEPQWLGTSAAEIVCRERPDLADLRVTYSGIDINAVPATHRRKNILIADMDSTIIPVECIDEIADFAGVKLQVADITARAMAGELDFEDALRARLALIRGLPEDSLSRIFAERISLNPGARILIRTMTYHGAHTALVSGGFTYFTERVAAAAGFAEHRANRLLIENGALSGEVSEPILGRAAKLQALIEITCRFGFGADAAMAVGDGANDISMIEAAGLGVAFHAKPVLEAKANAVIRHCDLTALLYLQGYREVDFQRG
jgi:phosphoserine phosphatase